MGHLTAAVRALLRLSAGTILGLNATNGTLTGGPNATLPLFTLNGTANCTALGNSTLELLNGTLVDNTTSIVPPECLNVTVLPPIVADSGNLTNATAGNATTPGPVGAAGAPGNSSAASSVGVGVQNVINNITSQINAGLQGVQDQLSEGVRAGIGEGLASVLPGGGAAGAPGGM
jgi:hypothetical protein